MVAVMMVVGIMAYGDDDDMMVILRPLILYCTGIHYRDL